MTSAVTIDRTTIVEHRSTRDGPAPGNYLVRLVGTVAGGRVVGVGECQPRGRVTGDDSERSWQFLNRAMRSLEGTRMGVGDDADLIGAVRRTLADLGPLPAGHGAPFRGTLLGIETAVLDLAARARRTPLCDLLGRRRSAIDVAGAAIPLDQAGEPLVRRYRRQLAVAGTIRFELGSDPAAGTRTLLALAKEHPPADPAGGWWLEARAGMTPGDARDLITALVKAMRRGVLPDRVILEQPIGASQRGELAALQRGADRLTGKERRRRLDLRIMADEGVATVDDLNELMNDGGCRAINIKSARVGGLLASLDLARAAVEEYPDTVVALSGMASTSDLSFWAMQHLALALPRLDHFTRTPVSDQSTNITDVDPAYLPGTRQLRPVGGAGLGVDIRFSRVLPDAYRYRHGPDATGPRYAGRPALAYPDEQATRLLGKTAMRSHLVEREALAYGLSSTRFSPVVFTARGDHGPPLMFGASARSPVSGACSFMISDQHKGAAQALLVRAGLPVPAGRVFAPSDLAGATSFARRIGFPVVTKPVSGTGGAGVSTNLLDEAQLAAGFEAVRGTRFARDDILVQRHIRGDVYRIMVNDGVVTAALLRIPPSVAGDGLRSIAELAAEKNTYRRENPRLRKGLIDSERTASYLSTLGRDLDFVPEAGAEVILAANAYLNLGGDPVDILDELHPSISEVAIRAVAAIPELRFCGVDILLEDHRRPIGEQSAGICELNACPELITPQFPLFGEPRFIARQLLAMAAARHGVPLPLVPAGELACRLSIDGRVGGEYVQWFCRRARGLAVRGWVEEAGVGRVVAVAAGGTVPVSTLAAIAIAGPAGSEPASVSTVHVAAPEVDDFSIRTGGWR